MLKKSITFKDLDNNEVTDIFHFHLTKAEIAELEVDAEGGSFQKMFEEIIEKNDKSKIIQTFKLVIRKAYGTRGEDNRRFIKNDEQTDAFLQSDAYSELFFELMTTPEAAAQFILGVIPEIPDTTPAGPQVGTGGVLAQQLDLSKSMDRLAGGENPVKVALEDARIITNPNSGVDLSKLTKDDLLKFMADMQARASAQQPSEQ